MQPLLRASHTGWGIGSLDQDAEDLRLLAQQLESAFGSEVDGRAGGRKGGQAGGREGSPACTA